MANELLQAVKQWADSVGPYALVLASVATIVMALVELAKAVTNVRSYFHRQRVTDFLGGTAKGELVTLTTGGTAVEAALFNQPTDKMMGQLSAAAKLALDFPQSYPNLYEALTGKGNAEATAWADYVKALANPATTKDASGVVQLVDPPEDQQRQATRARAHIDQLVTRKLDAFQLRTEFVWARGNQIAAVAGAAAFLACLLLPVWGKHPVTYVFMCITGGLISPVAKDVVTALSSLRTKWS